ncbi:acetamidase/formamidase family protein [Rhizobium sp. SYY.PMSO]|uniref:acetamidase/formamidase family protein n=1 Tax=Rhizobium sp. SYY.PMSO TaxID=3382192 RepID=UPI00398FE904
MVPLVKPEDFVFAFGGHAARHRVKPGEVFDIFTEDCFSGKLDTTAGQPREIAPFPHVNPLTGPIAVEGLRAGGIVAVHILALDRARDWGVATISPDFGLLSGTRVTPNLQLPQAERVWIWHFDATGQSLTTETFGGRPIQALYRPFFGTIGVAPAHGEVRLSVVPGDFGGNLDMPELRVGTTLYLRANVDGGHLYFGDGHYAQGDGEIAGTAIEGAFNASIVADILPPQPAFDWPRFETDTHVGVIGCARPLEDAARIATAGMIRWVAQATELDIVDAHQLVSQVCRLRIGNLVNPAFSAACIVPKSALGSEVLLMEGMHRRMRPTRSPS